MYKRVRYIRFKNNIVYETISKIDIVIYIYIKKIFVLYIFQKYYVIYIRKKRKCEDYKNLYLKFITNDNYYNFLKLLSLIYIIKILNYVFF